MSTTDLKVDGDNPNTMTDKQHARLKTSIEKYGFIIPIITNKDLLIADGEQRLTVAQSLQMKTVPVIRLPVEDVDRRLLRQVLNKLRGEHELLADAQEFQKIIEAGRTDDLKHLLDLSDNGLEKYLREIREVKDEDYEVPEIDKIQTDIKRGDIIQLGNHRLMCGDSTAKQDVEQLMNGKLANMFFSDPPYGVDYASKNEWLNEMDKGNHIQTAYANDSIKNYPQFLRKWLSYIPLENYNTIYIWSGNYQLFELLLASHENGIDFRTILIWVKNNHVLSRCDYQPKHELCCYGWKGKHKYYGGMKTTILNYDKPVTNKLHPTMKPIEMLSYIIPDGCQKGDIVLDYFGGSGSTLIACEQTGRTCYMMEIDPRYCQVIIDRWEAYTGQKAEKM